ncbi:prepilin-type N-terminal cleavage/methylation domain-containing protein [Aquincola sp. MAHUQ-54]|uniref:Prepilin-type N-terminal cleavage/methylation domain-containing protein n=1 Tax=Aquincola agrisoli TaxID=3119538 RepID=A0AAW9QAA1_9BURK
MNHQHRGNGRRPRAQRGVTLVEALVAFLVMAIGMLAAVGTQLTLRLNSDVAKQRSEAVRLAQNDLDVMRSFTTLPATEGVNSYADIVQTQAPVPLGFSSNTQHRLTRNVASTEDLPFRTVSAEITWEDRQGVAHPVRLDTIVAGIDPALSGYLGLVANGKPAAVVSRSNHRLPAWVRDLGNGRSVLKPAGSDTTAWIFDNRSGLIVSRCVVPANSTTQSLTLGDLSGCLDPTLTPLAGRLVAGYVRFSLASPPDPATPASPAIEVHPVLDLSGGLSQTSECFDDAAAAAGQRTLVQYYCAVFSPSAEVGWSGYLSLDPSTHWRGDNALYLLCRYTADVDASGSIGNEEHPLDYANVTKNLLNQNFLVVARGESCPLGTAQHDPRPL